jgi:hypothetical protein
VTGGARGLRISWPAGSEPPPADPWPLRATVDLETRRVTPRGDGVRGDLAEWLRGEMDDALVALLRERFRLAKR